MAKSRINIRFIAIFVAILALGAGFGGFWWYWQRVAAPERNFASGQRFMKDGDYRKAVSLFGRAVSKQQTNVKYLEALEEALQKFVPSTTDEGREYYNQLIGTRMQRARATPTEAGPWMEALETLYERNNVINSDILWREFSTDADQVGKRIPADDPAQNRIRFWKALGTLRRGLAISEPERLEAEGLLREALQQDPKFEAAWLELARSQSQDAQRLLSDQRIAESTKRYQELDSTLAAMKAAVPQSYAVELAELARMRDQADRRERNASGGPAVTPEAIDAARERLYRKADAIVADRTRLLAAVVELLNARSNEWLDRVIELLERRLKIEPNDMVARRLLMMAATQRKPDLAEKVALETKGMSQLPVSLESLVQDDARLTAITTLFNAKFEQWREQQSKLLRDKTEGKSSGAPEAPDALGAELLAMRDEAVKYLEAINERSASQLIQAKAALVERRTADAVALFDAVIKGQSSPPPDAFLFAAFANLDRGEPGSAIRIAREGLERFPAYTPLMMVKGEVEAQTGKYEDAARTYRQVIEIDPENKIAADRLKSLGGLEVTAAGAATANKGDWISKALGDSERKLLSRDVDGAEQELLLAQKRLDDQEARDKVPADRRDIRLTVALAQLYALLKSDEAKARQWITRGLAVQPNEERLLQFQATLSSKDLLERVDKLVELQYRDTPKARAVYRYLAVADLLPRLEGLARGADTPPDVREMAKSALERGQARLAADLDAALKAAPNSELLLEQAAQDGLARKDWSAVERIAAVADSAGERGIGATLRARVQLAQDRQAEGIALLEKARKAGDDSPMLLRQLSLLYERVGDMEAALATMREAYDRRPNEISTGRLYALLLDRSGQRTRALEILRELARANPTSRETMDAWLVIESEIGDRTGAAAMRRRLYNDAPGFRANALALAQLLLDSPGDLALMLNEDGKRRFTMEQLQAMTPLKRQQELQQAATDNLKLGLDIVRLLQRQTPGDVTLALMKSRALARYDSVKEGEASLRADIAEASKDPSKAEATENAKLLWLALGAYLAENGQPERSAEPFAQAVKLQDKDRREAEVQMADFWFSRQQWQRAREALEPVVLAAKGEPRETEGVRRAGLAMRLAEICQNLRDFDAATKYVDLAASDASKASPTVEMLRATVLIGRGEQAIAAGDVKAGNAAFEKAIERFRQATDLMPNNVVAWSGLADAERGMYLRTREPSHQEAAEKAADRALGILSTYLPAIRVKKDILIDRNDLDGAVKLIERYIMLQPQAADGRRLLIELHMRSGNPVRAILVAEQGAQADPRSPEWPLAIGTIQAGLGKESEATEAFDRAFSTEPVEDTLMRAVLSRVQRKQPDWAGVVTLLRANPKLVAGSPLLQGALGSALVNSKQRDAGLQALRNVHANITDGIAKKTYRPDAWDIWYAAISQAFGDKCPEAEAFVQAVLAGKTPDFYANRGLARIWRAKGKDGLDQTLKYLRQAIEAAKGDVELASNAAIEAGEAAYLVGECQRALPLFEEAIRLRPNFAPALNNAAFVTAKCGNAPDQAIGWAQKAVELAPQVADLQDTLGYVLMKSGKPEQALAPLQKAVTMAPAASPLLHLAEALAMTGRKDEARSTLERTKSLALNAEQAADKERIEKSLQ